MSIANLFQPNNYDLFCDTLTASELDIDTLNVNNVTMEHLTIGSTGAQSIPALTINNTNTINDTDIIQINCQNQSSRVVVRNNNAASHSNGFLTENETGLIKFQCGNNNSDNTGYVYTQNHADLKIGTHGIERLRILETGIPLSGATGALVLNGTILSSNVDFLTSFNGTFNVTFAGAINSIGVTITYQRVNKQVTLSIPLFSNGFSGVAGSITTSGSPIPVALRPANIEEFVCHSYNATAATISPSHLFVTNTGNITIWNGWDNDNFTTSNVGLFTNFTCTYLTS